MIETYLDPDSIRVDEDRYRKTLDEEHIIELMESIRNLAQHRGTDDGLINSISVDRLNTLVAGRCRLEAVRRLGFTRIRVNCFDDLTPLQKKIIEFEENDKRLNLTWQESAHAIEEIHKLQQQLKGRTWNASDTARSLGVSIGKVSEDLLLAASLANPRISLRPSRRGALVAVKRERELTLVRELARRRAIGLGIDTKTTTSTETSGGVVYNADCRSILSQMEEATVDLVIIDPPWGVNIDSASQWTNKWVHSYSDEKDVVYPMLLEVFSQLFRVLKPTCHLYTFFPMQEVSWWITTLTNIGFLVRQRPLIWYKSGQHGISSVYTSFFPAYEGVLWAYKPGANNIRRLFASPIHEARDYPRQDTKWHEAEKPVGLLKEWIEASSELNEVVLDCFAGGGSTLVAAYELGRYYVGVELDEASYQRAVKRLETLEEDKDGETEEDQSQNADVED